MPWPVHPTGFFGAQGDNDTYKIERSLRFNSADSAYLSRTPASAGNRKTWTWSGWVKRGALSSSRIIESSRGTGVYPQSFISIESDQIRIMSYNGSSYDFDVSTSAVYRDTASWYHFVISIDTTQATNSNGVKLWVNGTQQTLVFSAYTQNSSTEINYTSVHRIGSAVYANSNYLDGYLTEINFIDGQALTPSSFGETDAITGRWKAKAYSGTYGTNGFYLKFADNSGTTATTLGKDSSGNGNNWAPNNFSVTAGAGNDSLVDSPTNYGTDTGVGGEVSGNYATLNPLDKDSGLTLSNGNLDLVGANAGGASTFGITSGKWYWEVTITDSYSSPSTYWGVFGVSSGRANSYLSGVTGSPIGAGVYANNTAADAGTYSNGSRVTTQTTWANNDVIGFAFDAGAMTLDVYRNNSKIGTTLTVPSGAIYPSFYHNGVGGDTSASTLNFGQRPFAYTAPTGFKALCTTNLPTPTIRKPSQYMDVVTYTGNGTSPRTISGFGFSPDFLWIKNRTDAYNHIVYDTVRGAGSDKGLSTNTTKAENNTDNTNYGYVSAFTSDGFSTVTGSIDFGLSNTNSNTYVAWAWDEAPIAGMDIVSYTGDGTNRTIAHNLGVAPKMVIVKARSGSGYSWNVWHSSLANTEFLLLESTAAKATDATKWNSTSPTSSVFSLGTASGTNENARDYIAYLFAEVEGFSRFGSYTGNGSSDGPFVWCGFRPRYWIIKRTDSSGGWWTWDTARNLFNPANSIFRANNANAEDTDTLNYNIDFLSNGFKVRATSFTADGGMNVSGGTYIFCAFAESPFKYARAR